MMDANAQDSASQPVGDTVICVHEDREACLTGAKLTVLGLGRYAASIPVVVSCPGAPQEFHRWVSDQANAKVLTVSPLGAAGWNVKPALLLFLLETHSEVIWIDSDIVVTGPIFHRLVGLPPEVLLAAEETYWGQQQGGTFRTEAWGLRAGRSLATTVNSGVVRVTRMHIPLLRAWQKMLQHPTYLKAQSDPWYQRPLHMIGDQEVLTGLLGSHEFAGIPLKLLRRGVDIAQCFGPSGFTPVERMRGFFGSPPVLIHAMGPKPWRRASCAPSLIRPGGSIVRSLRNYYEYVSLDVSPYCIASRSYENGLREDAGWMQPRSRLGKAMLLFGFGNPCLAGLPLSIFDHAVRFLRQRLGVGRYSTSLEFAVKEPPY